ncbi:hypothetical protein [Microbulbifer sp. TRSA005]|uniref:hypothetical protein n=1 Tax=unclassified Microbulbifer TaxID=2619833 RepID=UPI004039C1A8
MKFIPILVVMLFVIGCESASITHRISGEYRPLSKVGIVFNSSDDVCLFGKKYSDIFNHREVVVGTSIPYLQTLGLDATEVDIRDYGANSEVLTVRHKRSNTAEVLDINRVAFGKIMNDFDLLLVMEHGSITGNWLQGDCFGAISIKPREFYNQYGSYALTPDSNDMAYSPPIMWIFKRGQYESKGVGVYFHRVKGVPFPYENPTDESGIDQFLSFYQEVIETELNKAFIGLRQANN